MLRLSLCFLALVLMFLGVVLCDAPLSIPPDNIDPKGYVAYRAKKPIVIDGKLDDEAWKDAPWSDEFQDIEGTSKPKPRYKTRMKMLWDDDYLYIAAEIEDPHVWATLKQHDSVIFQDNDFEVFLSPDGDSHNYAEMEMNAFNTTWDLLLTKPYKDGGKALNGWDVIGLKTGVHVNGTINDSRDRDKGWTVEIAWPMTGLKELSRVPVPPRDGDQWRINFSRVEWDINIVDGKYEKVKGKPENNWVWSPQGVIDMHRPERWGYVQFSTAAPGTIKFKPDAALPTKNALHRIYYAQREYYAKHQKYAASLEELGVKLPEGITQKPKFEITTNGYEIHLLQPGTPEKTWTITQDARIWASK
ncbi:hypothetical protein KIH39_24780 [Telmatocola sphagniphila]|uniref:Carbohydrate-binding domain-containing protein n=1 Tax=Telmatocola sphagniphila TaxID=1123043 RepID=A0A8E6B608_9BACT|nr:sugar-binding protein [Telmatocola sphagniphila]QVL32012.1 hypothetical protein KIH39_24780 [Telmatocola sphagniphila]